MILFQKIAWNDFLSILMELFNQQRREQGEPREPHGEPCRSHYHPPRLWPVLFQFSFVDNDYKLENLRFTTDCAFDFHSKFVFTPYFISNAGYADLLNDIKDFPHPEDQQQGDQSAGESNESIPASQLLDNLLSIGSAFSYL